MISCAGIRFDVRRATPTQNHRVDNHALFEAKNRLSELIKLARAYVLLG